MVLGRHLCSRQEDAPREEGRKKRLTLLFLYLGQRFNSKQNIWHGVGIPRGKASWKSPQSQAPEPWVPGDSLWGAAAPLTSGELGCSLLLLSDLFHQLQVVVTGFLVVHHGEGVILTWQCGDRDFTTLSKAIFPGFEILPAVLKWKCLILSIKEKSFHFDIRAFRQELKHKMF